MGRSAALLVGAYAWIATAAFGAVALDIVYAAQPDATSRVPAEAADLLLLLAGVTIAAGVVASLVAPTEQARAWLVASVVVVTVTLFLPLAGDAIEGAEAALGMRVGPWLRIGSSGLASILAFVGLWGSLQEA